MTATTTGGADLTAANYDSYTAVSDSTSGAATINSQVGFQTSYDDSSTYLAEQDFFSVWEDATTTTTDWLGGTFLQLITTTDGGNTASPNYLTTSLSLGTTGVATDFSGYGFSETIADEPTTSDATTCDLDPTLFPLEWLNELQTEWIPQTQTQSSSATAASSQLSWANSTLGEETAGLSTKGLLQSAVDGEAVQRFIKGTTFTWADGYVYQEYSDHSKINIGSADALNVVDMERFESARQTLARGFQGGKWPTVSVESGIDGDLTVSTQSYPKSNLYLQLASSFDTTNGPEDYNPENNFSTRTFGCNWGAVTGNQVTFGTGSGDFNLGPTLSFSYYSSPNAGSYDWNIGIDDDMVYKLYDGYEIEEYGTSFTPSTLTDFSVDNGVTDNTNIPDDPADDVDGDDILRKISDSDFPKFLSALNDCGDDWISVAALVQEYDISSSVFDDALSSGVTSQTTLAIIKRAAMVRVGVAEDFEIVNEGSTKFSWTQGNFRNVSIQDEKGKKRSVDYFDGSKFVEKTQKISQSHLEHVTGVSYSNEVVRNQIESLKTGVNFEFETVGSSFATSQTGFILGGPLKPKTSGSGNVLSAGWWEDSFGTDSGYQSYWKSEDYKAQGCSGDITFGNLISYDMKFFRTNLSVQIANPFPANGGFDMSSDSSVTETEVVITSTKKVANINLLMQWELDIGCAYQRNFMQLLQGDLKIGPEARFKTMQSNVEAREELNATGAAARNTAVEIAQDLVKTEAGSVTNVETVFTCLT
jgi:hypothetical protein